jgi:hypothetical protein
MVLNAQMRSVGLLIAVFAVLAGCAADPADEDPITLAAGNYFITTSQELAGTPAADYDPMGSLDQNVCVFPDETADFPETFTRAYLVSADCTLKSWTRKGNAFRGVRACPVSGQAEITLNMEFEGVVSADRIKILGQNKIHIPDSLRATAAPAAVRDFERSWVPMSRLEFRYAATHTGDCEKLSMPFSSRL